MKIYTQSIAISLITLVLLTSNCVDAQSVYSKEDCKKASGFEYGGLGGIYMASDKSADFYSGKPGNENTVNYLFSNYYWYEEIRQLLNFYDTIFVREYPEKMGYAPAFSFGLFAKYNFNCNTGIYLQFYYVKLKANDVVSFEVDPKEYLTEPDIRLLPIKGVEERNIVDLGINHAFGMGKMARLTVGGGISMNNSLVKEHSLYVENKKYNLIQIYGNRPYVPGSSQQAYDIRQGGIGFGLFASAGVRMEFSPAVAIEPGFSLHYMNVNIRENAGYTPEMNFYVRLIFRDILNFN
ncbi:MAG: hypothetical protein ACM3ME_04615 [Chloroflexota bacterium]